MILKLVGKFSLKAIMSDGENLFQGNYLLVI